MRSDTVTLPTEEMRKSMYDAELGDDGYGDDPTVTQLEGMAAEMFGKESALLVSSGTLGNMLAIISHCHFERNELILGQRSHILRKELSPVQSLFNVEPKAVVEHKGCMDVGVVRKLITNQTALISIENTHNRDSGAVVPLDHFKDIATVAREHGVPVHLDGARLFNAIIASGLSPRVYGQYVNSIMVCLSKGLSAPIGSLLIGKHSFINTARQWRKNLGGGMRQAGVIAAPGIIALKQMAKRLEDDHNNAKLLANELYEIKGISLNPDNVKTNIVIANINRLGIGAEQFVFRLKQYGILIKVVEPTHVRFTINRHIQKTDIYQTVKVIKEIISY